jgi:hypothetical protein
MKKTVTSLSLLVLVGSMILGSIPNHVYADSQSDSLIRIASQARDQLKIQLSKIDASQEIKEKFELGSSEIELLIQAAKDENVSAAREHFLSAMKIFSEIIQQISESPSPSEASLSVSQPETSRISNELDRFERYIVQLQGISDKNGFEIDFSKSHGLIDKARNELQDGLLEAANSTIEDIKLSINELNQVLREKTRQYTTDRAKTLAEKYLEDLDKLIAEAKEMGVSEETLARLVEARELLNSASDASDVAQIINELKRIIAVKQEFEDTKIQRFESRINQIEEKIILLSNSKNNVPELENAKEMLSKLKTLVSEGNLDEAIKVLNSLNNLLGEVENSINRQEEISSEADTSSSLSDSKTERIKIKIERLEVELNNLADKVEENAAAKRWLNNAFSLLENAKSQVDNSPDEALEIIMNIEQIIKRIQNTIQ